MRYSTWDTPRFIRTYQEDLEWIHLPRGLVERVVDLVEDLGSRLDVTDVRPRRPAVGLHFSGDLRPEQARAVKAAVAHERGVIVAPPGAGKTVMACSVIAHHDVPTLVIVDRQELVDQWRDRLVDHLGMERSQVGVIGGGKDKPRGTVGVAMIQSVARRDQPATLFGQYGLVVVDECHHVPAVSFEACLRLADCRLWLGLTATPYRRDGLERVSTKPCMLASNTGPTCCWRNSWVQPFTIRLLYE